MNKSTGNIVSIDLARKKTPESLGDIIEFISNVATYHISLLEGFVSQLVRGMNIDFFDRNGFRGFLVDVVNCIINDEDVINDRLQDMLNFYKERQSVAAACSLLGESCREEKTDNKILSEMTYRNLTESFDCNDFVFFAASIFWLTSGKYCHEKIPSTLDILRTVVRMNYDYDNERFIEQEQAINNLPAWFVRRMIDDVWQFAAIMADGEFIVFDNIFSIVEDDDLFQAIINQDSFGSVQHLNRPVDEYQRHVIRNGNMELLIKLIKEVNGADGSIWLDAEISENSAYERNRRNVSINKSHIIDYIDRDDGWSLVRFPVRVLRLVKEKREIIDLHKAVMFFEIADT